MRIYLTIYGQIISYLTIYPARKKYLQSECAVQDT